MKADRLRLLHLHSSFHAGGKELRAARLMTLFGPGVQHTVVSAQPEDWPFFRVLARAVKVLSSGMAAKRVGEVTANQMLVGTSPLAMVDASDDPALQRLAARTHA